MGDNMDKNKVIIFILLVVIAILAAGLVMSNMHSIEKKQTKLTILGNSSINEGDAIKVKLTDLNKTPIANQTVNITVTGKDNTSEYFSVVTNDKGVGKLDVNKSQGEYKINCTYGGNDNYMANSTAKKIKIVKKAAETESSSTESQESSNSDDYVYSRQAGGYVKKSGQYDTDTKGNTIYSYQGDDGVIYQKYYDSNGNPISSQEYMK